MPSTFEPWATNTNAPVLEVRGLVKHFPLRRGLFKRATGAVRAVDGVDFSLQRGKTFGLVGESGCGKTTTGRLLLRLERPTAGAIRVDGVDIASLEGEELARYRRRVQMVFQDPNASLDPKMSVGESVAEPLNVQSTGTRTERRERVIDLMEKVGLDGSYAGRYPHQLSGGQRQRVGIARALALGPEIVVADEPTSALDVSVRAQVINLLRDLQRALDLSFVFISHDLSTVRYVSDDVAVMYLGEIVEQAPSEELFANPGHPYTRALLSAVPVPDPVIEASRASLVLEGEIPSPAAPPPGCRFHTRCPLAFDRRRTEAPELRVIAPDHVAACHLLA